MALTQQQLDELKRDLVARRTALVAEIQGESEVPGGGRLAEVTGGGGGDAGDAAIADLMADTDAAMTDRDVRELRDIDAALERMRDGSYGECLQCGGEIEFERLKAYPTATRDIRCQTDFEKTHASAGTPTR